jgi:nitroreductase
MEERIMMNETITQIKKRKSVRIFEDRPIPAEIKDELLEAAFQAPTAGAMMLYSIIDVTDQSLKEKLAVSCDNQPFIAKAPLVLIFLADYQRWYDTFVFAGCGVRKPGEGDLLLACADAVIAAQNTVVAAESLGLGSCYIGDIIENYEVVRPLLDLPEFVIPAAMLVYGYPAESQKNRKKPPRFDREYIVYENAYRRFSSQEHTEMHARLNRELHNAEKDIPESIRAFCKRKYMSDFSLEMSRSAGKYMDQFRNNREEVTKDGKG